MSIPEDSFRGDSFSRDSRSGDSHGDSVGSDSVGGGSGRDDAFQHLSGSLRRALARMPGRVQQSGNTDFLASMPQAPRRFTSTQHLAFEAVVAYVDGELRMNAHMRAATHIAECPVCAGEVDAQRQARTMLRESGEIAVPRHLLGALSQIPSAFDAPEFPTHRPPEDDGARRAAAGRRGRRKPRG